MSSEAPSIPISQTREPSPGSTTGITVVLRLAGGAGGSPAPLAARGSASESVSSVAATSPPAGAPRRPTE